MKLDTGVAAKKVTPPKTKKGDIINDCNKQLDRALSEALF